MFVYVLAAHLHFRQSSFLMVYVKTYLRNQETILPHYVYVNIQLYITAIGNKL